MTATTNEKPILGRKMYVREKCTSSSLLDRAALAPSALGEDPRLVEGRMRFPFRPRVFPRVK